MEGSVVLCDYAQVHAGKLYVVGGGVNLAITQDLEPPHQINLYAAILITVPWTAHNQAHTLVVSLLHEDGKKIELGRPLPGAQPPPEEYRGSIVGRFNAGRSPIMRAGDESVMPLVVPLILGVPKLDEYRLDVQIDGSSIASAKFRVINAQDAGMSVVGLPGSQLG